MADIDINMDAKCRRCRKPGATQSGLCLKCITKGIETGEFDRIFNKEPSMAKTKSQSQPDQSPKGEAIEFENCGVASVKADLVSGGVKITIGVSFSQLPPDVRARLAQVSELEQPVRVTIQPMQMSLNLGPKLE